MEGKTEKGEHMIDVKFVNFQRSEALEEYVQKHIHPLIRRLQKKSVGPHHFEVNFKLDARAPFGQVKSSEVVLIYRYPGLTKDFVVKKKGADLRKVLMQAIHSLKDAVQKATEKREGGRRHGQKRNATPKS